MVKKLLMKTLLLVTICLLIICFVPRMSALEKDSSSTTTKSTTSSLVTSQGIDIRNDSAFSLYGLPGTGTPSNPYLIQNFVFSANIGSAISIQNTNKSFIVEDCTILSTNVYGIYIGYVHSSLSKILNNNLTNNIGSTITIENSSNILISGNTNSNDSNGFSVWRSDNIIISQNYATNTGLGILSSKNILVENNYFNDSVGDGISLNNCFNVTIRGTVVTYSLEGIGIDFIGTNYSIVFNNSVGNDYIFGLALDANSTHNLIYYNLFYNSTVGQVIDNGQQNLFYNATVKEGNYYSDWTVYLNRSLGYPIPGTANNTDLFPLDINYNYIRIYTNESVQTKVTTSPVSLIGILCAIPSLVFISKRKFIKNK